MPDHEPTVTRWRHRPGLARAYRAYVLVGPLVMVTAIGMITTIQSNTVVQWIIDQPQQFLGKGVRVVSAFQNVAAPNLQDDNPVHCDVLVAGNDPEARQTVIGLVEAVGLRGYHAGPIANAAAAEAITSILIGINRKYKCHAGIAITGVD